MKLLSSIFIALILSATILSQREPLGKTESPIIGSKIVKGYTADTFGNHSVNSYFLIGDGGITLIDTQWRISDAQRVLKYLRQNFNKPVTAIFITHPHTDHFGGLPIFRDAFPKADVYASTGTIRNIKIDAQGFIANRQKEFKNDFPAEFTLPNKVIGENETLKINGLEIETLTLRSNEAEETTLFYLPKERALFTGDLINNKTTPVLFQSGLDSWIEQLKTVREKFKDAKIIYPGHGKSGAANELIEAESNYLNTFRDLIAAELFKKEEITETGQEQIITAMEQKFPDWRTSAGIQSRRKLIGQNIDSVLRAWRFR